MGYVWNWQDITFIVVQQMGLMCSSYFKEKRERLNLYTVMFVVKGSWSIQDDNLKVKSFLVIEIWQQELLSFSVMIRSWTHPHENFCFIVSINSAEKSTVIQQMNYRRIFFSYWTQIKFFAVKHLRSFKVQPLYLNIRTMICCYLRIVYLYWHV